MATSKEVLAQSKQDVTKVLSRIKEQAETISDVVDEALHFILVDIVINKSVPITPIEFGTLRRSAYVDKPVAGSVKGGFGAEYAVYVHERLDTKHRPPTRAKFLEEAYNKAQKGFKERLAKETAKRWVARVRKGDVKVTGGTSA